MLGKIFNFRFRLAAAIFLVAMAATVSGLSYYYHMTSAQIWAQTTSRVKDFGKLGVTLFTATDLKYLQELDQRLNTATANKSSVPGVTVPALSALSDDEKTALIRKTNYQLIVQKLRHLRFASGKSAAHEDILPAEHKDNNNPQIHRVWIAGIKMHEITPLHLRVLVADEFEEIDRDNNGKIDPHEKLYRIGDIFGGKNFSGLAEALRGELAVSDGYRAENSGVFITGFTPIKNNTGKVIALLIIDFSAASEFDALFRLKVTGYYITVAVLLLSVIAALTTSKLLLKPLETMQQAALRIARRDFSIRIELGSSDELSDLAYAMNLMAEELGEYSSQMERRITQRTRELAGILESLEQGVLAIDRNGIIQAEYSRATLAIFGLKEIAHRRFIELFSDEKLAAAVEQYTTLYFSGNAISASMLEKANPLRQIQYHNAKGELRYLRFSFRPLNTDTAEIQRLLVTIVDETHEIELREKILQAESEKRAEFDAIINMMRLPAPILNDFMAQQKEFLHAGKQLISTFGSEPFAIKSFAARVHALKGNALQLGFSPLAEKLHQLEGYLAQAAKSAQTDLRFLRHEISRAVNACEELILNRDKLVERIRELVGKSAVEQATREELRHFWLEQIRHKAATHGIETVASVEFAKGTELAVQKLHNAIVQLVRNTFAHGLESIAQRRERKKPDALHISLVAKKIDTGIEVVYTEDGRGIEGFYAERPLPLSDLIQKGLTSGRTTATLEAGRGLGMEYITAMISELGGSITVKSSERETVFRIALPN